jgi:hypothetical protein
MAFLTLVPQLAISKIPTDEIEDEASYCLEPCLEPSLEPSSTTVGFEGPLKRYTTSPGFYSPYSDVEDEGDDGLESTTVYRPTEVKMIEEHELERIRALVENGELDDASALLKRLVRQAPTHEELQALRVELRCRMLARTVVIAS